jgi:cellobiose phosphorylase
MDASNHISFRLPLEDELGLHRLTNAAGLEIAVLPNGCVFAIEHVAGGEQTLINQVFGSPLGGGIGRVLLRLRDGNAGAAIAGSGAAGETGFAADRAVWAGETEGVRHRVTLWLHPEQAVWFWHIELENTHSQPLDCDAFLTQDLGLGGRGLVLSNEAYASQYIDHTIEQHPRFGPVVMSRQNMAQFGRNPWAAHGCLDGAAGFATDALQIFGPAYRRIAGRMPALGAGLPSVKLQHETACTAVQSAPLAIPSGAKAAVMFFGLYLADHPAATSEADLERLEDVERAAQDFKLANVALSAPARSVVQDAPPLSGRPPTSDTIEQSYPQRMHEEWQGAERLSFFMPDGPHNRHVVLAAKERLMRRRHGAILRSGNAILPDENALSATCWMHGVFAAQLTIGNTALHKLFSVSRDPYNITRTSGLRILVDRGEGWRLLTEPSFFDMGLNDCRWVYRLDDGTISIQAIVSAVDTVMQWHMMASGKPCRFMVFAHLVIGEHDFRHASLVEIDHTAKRICFRPDSNGLWGQTYPGAVHHLVISTPETVEAIGSGTLLFDSAAPRSADAYIAIKTKLTDRLSFALVGDLKDPERAERLARKYEQGVETSGLIEKGNAFWSRVTRNTCFPTEDPDMAAIDAIFPWFAQNAMIHLTAPRGLEQYSAAAWGTRDVCQGPVEFLLSLGHHQAVREILHILFSQQYDRSGDWPQWFMLEPYGQIRDRHSHGDIIIWPLKALCDYLETTGNMAFLAHPLPWTQDDFSKTPHCDAVAMHVERLIASVRERFIPGTHLLRYGLGDWNDSLQPADPCMRDWMVSSWTVALFYQQLLRYAQILLSAGKPAEAGALDELAARIRADFNRYLMPGDTVAGYALFKPDGGEPAYLLHPTDRRTGVNYSLIPMTRAIIAGLFTTEQARRHLRLIRKHLLFPDGARLMDKPVRYRGGVEIDFRRAESAAFFGREIGLMYTHAHLRYCEALGVLGDMEALRKALQLANPITATEACANAALRQRNAYFSSSDAAFPDRYHASSEWIRVNNGAVDVDGGWRIYSSGPGIFIRLAVQGIYQR